MASSVTAPLERQFGQMPGLKQMTLDQLVRRLGHHAAVRPRTEHRRRRAGGAGGDQRRRRASCRATCRTRRSTARSIRPTRRSSRSALTSTHAAAVARSRTSPTRRSRRRSRSSPASAWSRISGGQKPAVRVQANPDGARVVRPEPRRPAHRRSRRPTSTRPRATSTARAELHHRRQRSALRERRLQAGRSSPTATARRCASRDVANVVDGVENAQQAAWMNDDAGRDREHPAPARREHHRRRRPHRSSCCRSSRAALPPSVKVTVLTDRTDDHPRLGARRRVRADAHHRAGRDGDLPLPAQRLAPRSSRASPCRCRSSARSA